MVSALYDHTGHAAAATFYRAYPREPVSSGGFITIDNLVPVRHITLTSLLDAMSHLPTSETTVVIVCHSSSYMLKVPLTPHSVGIGLDESAIDLLNGMVAGRHTEQQVATSLAVSEADVHTLHQRLIDVRARNWAKIIFRSCNLGSSLPFLTKMKSFFGARTACAPTLYDFYGSATPAIVPDLTNWWREHPTAQRWSAELGIYVDLEQARANDFRSLRVAGTSAQAITAFFEASIGPRAGRARLPLHAMLSFVDGAFYFPLDEANYRPRLTAA